MINIRSVNAKKRAWIVFDRMLRRFEKIIYKKVRVYVARQYSRAAAEVRKGNSIDRAITAESNQLLRIIAAYYKTVMTAFGDMILSEKAKKKDISTRTVFWNKINRWIRENAGKKITRIDNTTKNTINRIVRKGMLDGSSNRDIADSIIERTDIDSMRRAIRIARTETHQTANKGSLEMAREINMKFKEWLAAKDERVRESHEQANGQTVEMEEMFDVGDEELDCPGDVNGSAKNIINCRCTMVYHGGDEDTDEEDNSEEGE